MTCLYIIPLSINFHFLLLFASVIVCWMAEFIYFWYVHIYSTIWNIKVSCTVETFIFIIFCCFIVTLFNFFLIFLIYDNYIIVCKGWMIGDKWILFGFFKRKNSVTSYPTLHLVYPRIPLPKQGRPNPRMYLRQVRMTHCFKIKKNVASGQLEYGLLTDFDAVCYSSRVYLSHSLRHTVYKGIKKSYIL